MPNYQFHCDACNTDTDRVIRLAEYEAKIGVQRCAACEGPLEKVSFTVDTCPTFIGRKKPMGIRRPRVRGFDSGPTGFSKGRQENDGCCDPSQRDRLRKNAAATGENISGGFFVGGLCRPGIMDDPYAVCRSKEEVVAKAQEQGVCVHGPGIDFEPTIQEHHYRDVEENRENYRPAPSVVRRDVIDELRATGQTPTPSVVQGLTEKFQEKFGQSPIHAPGPSLERLLDAPVSALKEVPG